MHSVSGAWKRTELPATLTLLLASDLTGARQREGKCRLDVLMAGDLAADVTDQPSELAAQDPQLPAVTVELLGVSIAPGHHRRVPGDPDVGLPKPHAVLVGQAVDALDGGVHQLGIGREADVLGLHRGVDRDPLEVSGCAVPRWHAPPASSRPTATPVCRRAAYANGSGRSAHAGTRAGKTLPR